MESLLIVLALLTRAIFWLVLIHLIIGLLIQFDVLNPRQPFVIGVYNGIGRLLNPLLDPIRRLLPPTGGLDFSPMVLLLALTALQIVIANNL